MLMDIHKQAIEKISASKIRKQQEAPWDFVYIIIVTYLSLITVEPR